MEDGSDIDLMRSGTVDLTTLLDHDFEQIIEAIGDSRYVFIGESSHGTEEFYSIRATITKKLIEEKGFGMVAVEADFPDAYELNRFVQGKSTHSTAKEALEAFERYPKWMWRNKVTESFVDWLQAYNRLEHKQVGFYGLDIYGLKKSLQKVLDYLSLKDPEGFREAQLKYSTLQAFQYDEQHYGLAIIQGLIASQKSNVADVLSNLLSNSKEYIKNMPGGILNGDEYLFATENAQAVVNAEEYYRAMMSASSQSTWNLRDYSMICTLKRLLHHLQEIRPEEKSKCIVWAHNSHIGDARARAEGSRREWNMGQLAREQLGQKNTFLLGFTTYAGSVTASNAWDGPTKRFILNRGLPNSYESLFHDICQAGNKSILGFGVVFKIRDDPNEHVQNVLAALSVPRLERFIGVQYVKRSERYSHYQQYNIVKQFDSVIHIDMTSNLIPLDDITQE